jgi:hypothetical protein
MFAIVYKEDSVPMCARLKAEGPDSVVFWPTEEGARGFLATPDGPGDGLPGRGD